MIAFLRSVLVKLICLNPLVLIGYEDPGIPKNSARIASTFTFPNTVTYTCNDGFKMLGYSRRHCLTSGPWSGVLPTCSLHLRENSNSIFQDLIFV